jgi:sarcosine oxidase gamma subunit
VSITSKPAHGPKVPHPRMIAGATLGAAAVAAALAGGLLLANNEDAATVTNVTNVAPAPAPAVSSNRANVDAFGPVEFVVFASQAEADAFRTTLNDASRYEIRVADSPEAMQAIADEQAIIVGVTGRPVLTRDMRSLPPTGGGATN